MVVQPGFEETPKNSETLSESNSPQIIFASFGSRVGAALIDAMIESMLQFVIGWGLALGVTLISKQFAPDGVETPAIFVHAQKYSVWATALFLAFMNQIVLVALYGGTIGKRLLGLKIMKWDEKNRTTSPIGWGLATARYFAKFLSALTFFVGFLMPLWTKNRQTLHDMSVSTVVIER